MYSRYLHTLFLKHVSTPCLSQDIETAMEKGEEISAEDVERTGKQQFQKCIVAAKLDLANGFPSIYDCRSLLHLASLLDCRRKSCTFAPSFQGLDLIWRIPR